MISRVINRVRTHPLVESRPVVRQFIKFAMVGVVNTLTSITIYFVASRPLGWDPLAANAAAFVVAVTVSFVLNKRWTFRDQGTDHARQYTKFMLINLVGLGLSTAIIWLFHKRLGWPDLVAFFQAVGLVLFWNFFANRWWTFRSGQSQ